MYLLIFEDGALIKTKELDKGIFDGCQDGVIDIVNLNNGTVYNHTTEMWTEIEEK